MRQSSVFVTKLKPAVSLRSNRASKLKKRKDYVCSVSMKKGSALQESPKRTAFVKNRSADNVKRKSGAELRKKSNVRSKAKCLESKLRNFASKRKPRPASGLKKSAALVSGG